MKWILIGLGVALGIAVLNIVSAMFIDNKVLLAAAARGFDAMDIPKGTSQYMELVTLLKQCRAKGLTVEESADAVVSHFAKEAA